MEDVHTSRAGRELPQYAEGPEVWLTTLDHKRIGIMYLGFDPDRVLRSAACSRCSCASSC